MSTEFKRGVILSGCRGHPLQSDRPLSGLSLARRSLRTAALGPAYEQGDRGSRDRAFPKRADGSALQDVTRQHLGLSHFREAIARSLCTINFRRDRRGISQPSGFAEVEAGQVMALAIVSTGTTLGVKVRHAVRTPAIRAACSARLA